VVVAVALLLLLEPFYIHAALDASGSAAILGVTPGEAHRLSDETVAELFVGPGTFAEQWRIACPGGPATSCLATGQRFYDPAEVRHLQDVRLVLWAFLWLAAAAAVVLILGLINFRRKPAFWRSIARGAAALAIGTVVVGVLFEVAFDPMFTLFHELFFPGGDWAFDPATERLVQLYPIPFWELTTTVLAVLILAGSALAWWLARAQARRGTLRDLAAGAGTAVGQGSPGAAERAP
jgi:hypothetical protein